MINNDMIKTTKWLFFQLADQYGCFPKNDDQFPFGNIFLCKFSN